jgi:triosephosphate isomerase
MAKPRGVFIAGNWKMNHGPAAARSFIQELGTGMTSVNKPKGLRAAILTPAVSLTPAVEAIESAPSLKGFVEVGAQNAHFEAQGAFTGELSAPLLREVGVNLTLVGHSERRQYFGETNETAGRRLASLLHQGMDVIFCIGETLSQRQASKTEQVVLEQLEWAFRVAAAQKQSWNWSKLSIAYEPVWAIGTGVTATPEQAQEVHALIRRWLTEIGAPQTPVLYGGSVTPENIAGLLACPDVDGGLVGGASLKAEAFLKLIQAGAQAI